MKLFQSSQDRDLELLSAFIDNELSANERADLERRLKAEPRLRATLADLRGVHSRLASLPKVSVPRSFTLKPQMVGYKPRKQSNLIPIFNYASALAATLFAVLVGAQLATGVQPFAAPQAQSANTLVMEAPEMAADAQLSAITQSPDTATLTGEAEIGISALTITESAQEPLTSGGGGQSGGGGTGQGGDATGQVPPNTGDGPANTAPVADGTAEMYYDSGTETPGDILRVTGTTDTPPAEEATPKDVGTEATTAQTTDVAASPNYLQLGAVLAGAAFVLFLAISLFLRRR